MGSEIQAFGQYSQGQDKAASDKYNAAVSFANAKIAEKNAEIAGQAGAEQSAMASQKGRSSFGAIKTNQAASGVDVNSGSAVETQSSVQELSKLDAMTIRSNAAKEAYGYKVQQSGMNDEGYLMEHQAHLDAEAGTLAAVGTLLGAGESGLSDYSKYLSVGGLGG